MAATFLFHGLCSFGQCQSGQYPSTAMDQSAASAFGCTLLCNIFSALDRKIIPIDFGDRLRSNPQSELGTNISGTIWLGEPDSALEIGPTAKVVTGIQSSGLPPGVT